MTFSPILGVDVELLGLSKSKGMGVYQTDRPPVKRTLGVDGFWQNGTVVARRFVFRPPPPSWGRREGGDFPRRPFLSRLAAVLEHLGHLTKSLFALHF